MLSPTVSKESRSSLAGWFWHEVAMKFSQGCIVLKSLTRAGGAMSKMAHLAVGGTHLWVSPQGCLSDRFPQSERSRKGSRSHIFVWPIFRSYVPITSTGLHWSHRPTIVPGWYSVGGEYTNINTGRWGSMDLAPYSAWRKCWALVTNEGRIVGKFLLFYVLKGLVS